MVVTINTTYSSKYIAKVIDGERWYFVGVDGVARSWSKQAQRGTYWYGLPAAKEYAEKHFAKDEVVVGGKARMI